MLWFFWGWMEVLCAGFSSLEKRQWACIEYVLIILTQGMFSFFFDRTYKINYKVVSDYASLFEVGSYACCRMHMLSSLPVRKHAVASHLV